MGHVIVVGGTGMLRGATTGLATQGHDVSVVARRSDRLAAVAKAVPGKIHPLAVDYRDTKQFLAAVREAQAHRDPFSLCVSWIHSSTAPDAALALAQTLGENGRTCAFFNILGSSWADPSRPRPEIRRQFEAVPGLTYHEVILGFVPYAHGGSRWLTNEEISDGVLAAIAAGQPRYIVGKVEPWSWRP